MARNILTFYLASFLANILAFYLAVFFPSLSGTCRGPCVPNETHLELATGLGPVHAQAELAFFLAYFLVSTLAVYLVVFPAYILTFFLAFLLA